MTERVRGRILLAAYHFPPSAAVGGLRVTRFARFLPEFGWEPHVLTIRDADRDPGEGEDLSRLVGLEDVPVTKTRVPSGPIRFYTRIKARLKGPRSQASGSAAAVPDAAAAGPRRESLWSRVKRYVTSLVVLLPDEQKNWSLLASLTAVRLVRRHRLDWVLTSGPPFSVHFVGLAVRTFTGARWMADFRDPWVEMLSERPSYSRSWLSDRIEMWMEGLVMRHADRVLTTTERMRTSFLSRHPHLPETKFECLPNGIDSNQVPADEITSYDRLTITYAGTLYFDRTPEPLFRAVGELLAEGVVRPEDLSIKLVGNCARIGAVDTLDLARQYGVEATVEVIPRVPRAEAFRIMQRSHLLLVLAPPNHGLVLPAKIFDYLGSGAQILALAEPGATADLVEETGCGRAFASTDTEGLKAYLAALAADGSYRTRRNATGAFRRYEASQLVQQLAASLSDASEQRAGLVEST